MKPMRRVVQVMAAILYVAIATMSMQTPAHAGLVGTGEVIAQQQGSLARTQVLDALARDDVKAQLVALGVDPADAAARVAALNDEEMQTLATRMQDLPAGGNFLGVVVFLFLVLLLTDILGFTDIFPFVKKTAR